MKKLALVCLLAAAVPSLAALITAHSDATPTGAVVDGVLGPGEYGSGAYQYLGAGTGFGGVVGNGALYMDSDAGNLYIGFQPGGNLNDNVVIMLDTRAGGFLDADMRDRADGGRRGASEQCLEADDAYPAGVFPDFAVVIGSFGIVLFELTAGSTDGHLNFLNYDGTFTGNGTNFREYAIPLATLGRSVPGCIKFFVPYISDSGYASNESIPPYDPLQLNGNPGFGDGQFGGTVGTPGYGNHNEFCVYPEPTSLALLGLLAGLVMRRR